VADVADRGVLSPEERIELERTVDGDERLAVVGLDSRAEGGGLGGDGAAGGDDRNPGCDGELDGAAPSRTQRDPTYVSAADTTISRPIITAVARRRVRSSPRRRR
jgi:hypothetical protein